MLRILVIPFITGICIVFLGLAVAVVAYEQFGTPAVDEATVQVESTPTRVLSSQTLVSSAAPPPTSTLPPAATATPQPTATPPPTATAVPPTVIPQPVAPAPPSGLNVSFDPAAGVVLRWQAVPGAGYYNVYRSDFPGGGEGAIYTALGSIAAAEVRDNTAQPGRRYYYVVTAVSAGLQSQPSNEASVDVP